MGTSGILQSLRGGKKGVHQLFLLLLLCFVLLVLPDSIKAQPLYVDHSISYIAASVISTDTTGEVWNSGSIPTVCAGNITVVYSFGGTGTGSPVLEYNLDGTVWNPVGVTGSIIGSGTQVAFRITVSNLLNGDNVTLDLLAYEPFTVTLVSATNITCNGAKDGAIEVVGRCGQALPTSYTWTGPNSYSNTGSAISSLEDAGPYDVTVSNGIDVPDVVFNHVITEPGPLSFSVSGQDYSCVSPGCTGLISVSPSGGTTPYKYFLDAVETPYPFPNQCGSAGGTVYSVNLSDANNCTTAGAQTFTIYSDVAAPVCTTYPADYLLDIGAGSPPSGTLETLADNNYSYTGGSASDTIEFSVNAQEHNNIKLEVIAFQTTQADWTGSEFLKVYVSNNGGSSFQTVVSDYCAWEGHTNESSGGPDCTGIGVPTTTGWLSLAGTDGKSLTVRIVFKSSAPHDYTIQNIRLRGNKLTSAFNPVVTGQPTFCVDPSVPTVTRTDGAIHWYCNSPGNQEFYFDRQWRIADNCNNFQIRNQRIVVGTAPVITAPVSRNLDFCFNAGVNINKPVVTENCGTPAINWEITGNGSGVTPNTGTGDIVNQTFPQPVLNDTTYTITWTAIDSAGFSSTADQYVNIKHMMHISLTPHTGGDFDFCPGESVSFNVSLTSGGTGLYNAPTFNPAGGSWSGTNQSGVYTTTGLFLNPPGPENIEVTYTDRNNGGVTGGCSTTETFHNNTDYIIHQKIATKTISRN